LYKSYNGRDDSNDERLLPHTKRDKSSPSSKYAPPRLPIIILWVISTIYGIFYSFEVTFLYLNDQWYALLPIQILFTTSDVISWIYLILIHKYKLCNNSLANFCIGIKLSHLLFNTIIENYDASMRHVLFLLEDSIYLWCAYSWLGVGEQRNKLMMLWRWRFCEWMVFGSVLVLRSFVVRFLLRTRIT
jgi:hypothetical protein